PSSCRSRPPPTWAPSRSGPPSRSWNAESPRSAPSPSPSSITCCRSSPSVSRGCPWRVGRCSSPRPPRGPIPPNGRLAPELEASLPLSLAVLLSIVAVLLLSMAVYALRGHGPDADAQSKDAQFAGGAANFVLHWFLWVVNPAAALSMRLGLTADFYNFAG